MKIALGTVQFGLDYGVSNTDGKTSQHNAQQILQYAHNAGIDMIDTAALYGNSENVIGNSIAKDIDWKIITKTPHFIGDCINLEHVKQLTNFFNKSLLNLGRKNIYGLLIHSCDDLLKPGGTLLFKEMEKLKSQGLVKKIGVSLYDSKQIEVILGKFNIDLVQLPINILDQNFLIHGWLKKLKENNVEIHARSVFLQGLLLIKKKLVSPYFLPIEEQLSEFYKLAEKLSLTQLELALGYVTGINEIDRVVVGVNTATQLQEIVKAINTKVGLKEFSGICVDNPIYTNPSLWKM
jgi:aryl-alcohol dehydrogenase-like predicted oxidoreductase